VTSARRSGSRGASSARPARRKRVWFFSEAAQTHATPPSSQSTDVLADARTSLGVNGFPGWTISAIVGQIYADIITVAIGSTLDLRYGVVKASQQATISALPVPYQEDGDFMWTETEFKILDNITGESNHGVRQEVRVRSMRKLEEVDDTLFMVIRQNSSTAAIVRWRLRILLLAP